MHREQKEYFSLALAVGDCASILLRGCWILSILDAACVAASLSRAQSIVLFREEEGDHRGKQKV